MLLCFCSILLGWLIKSEHLQLLLMVSQILSGIL